ncbi:MAG TPA: metal-sulfur cluster assembly factor [Acidimicrobiia bacterium]|nr:metal-sulfur cluster assembly factor [Acidimicrobiia bacterium]
MTAEQPSVPLEGLPLEDSIESRALDALHEVVDPELGLDIVDLGLVYDVRTEDGDLVVEMTLTTPGCPVSESLPAEAQAAIARAVRVPVRVEVVWDPPWTPERIAPEAARALGLRR